MSSIKQVNNKRRQPYITQVSYDNTLRHFDKDYDILAGKLEECGGDMLGRTEILSAFASTRWFTFRLKFTAGVELGILRTELTDVVAAYQKYVDEVRELSEDEYYPSFTLNDLMDTYVNYLDLISYCILLHREDLLPKVFGLIEDSEFDGEDGVIEELFKFFFEDRPELDEWFWEKPYRGLLDAIDNDDPKGRSRDMKKYVPGWYGNMKGQALFWGKHKKIKDSFSPYYGCWATCAAAFAYLYDIDDSSFRDELVYPKDLVEYARSIPRAIVTGNDGKSVLRVLGGQACPRAGKWFSPAKEDSYRHFTQNEHMPEFPASEYGTTIWQWVSD